MIYSEHVHIKSDELEERQAASMKEQLFKYN